MDRKSDGRDTDAELLALIEELAAELHPNRGMPALGLDSDLCRDAGLDSLGRIELMLRIQHRFGARLADEDAICIGARYLQGMVPALRTVETVDRLRNSPEPPERVRRAGTDLAFLQSTSGTTGAPKGVMLSHANLLANIRAMGSSVSADSGDRFVSWLPLYHDMGLIGACLATLYYGIEVILMSPLQFMARPERWLRAIHNFGGTISAGPNFAYDLCAGRVRDEAMEGLDLSN